MRKKTSDMVRKRGEKEKVEQKSPYRWTDRRPLSPVEKSPWCTLLLPLMKKPTLQQLNTCKTPTTRSIIPFPITLCCCSSKLIMLRVITKKQRTKNEMKWMYVQRGKLPASVVAIVVTLSAVNCSISAFSPVEQNTRQWVLFTVAVAVDANDSIFQMAAADNGKRHFTSLSPSSLSTGHHHHHQHWQGDKHSSSDRQRKRLEQTAGSLSCARTTEHQVTLVLVLLRIGARWHLSPVMCRQKNCSSLQQS